MGEKLKPNFAVVRQSYPHFGRNCWRIIETNVTSDGLRTRICDGIWHTEDSAMESLRAREGAMGCARPMPNDVDKEDALEILNMLCPLTRRDTWWHTEAPQSLLEDFVAKLRARYQNG